MKKFKLIVLSAMIICSVFGCLANDVSGRLDPTPKKTTPTKGHNLPCKPIQYFIDTETWILTINYIFDFNSTIEINLLSGGNELFSTIAISTVDGTIIANLPALDNGVYELRLTINGITYSGMFEI